MKLPVHIERVPPVLWLWVLLIAAVAAIGVGMANSWHVLTGAGVVLFIVYASMNGQPPRRRFSAANINSSNPATGSALVPGTFTDGPGRYTGSTG